MKAIDYIHIYQQRVNQALDQLLPSPVLSPSNLHEAMRYSTLGGGKRLRPILVYASGTALGIQLERLDSLACAVELIHAYSLIHDDLPAMDNDDLRRGKPTCHKAFDEATAILAGDALQCLAFQVLAENQDPYLTPQQRITMITLLTRASGSLGMTGGQALDLAAVNRKVSLQEIEAMHRKKTGALIEACVNLAIVAAATNETLKTQNLIKYSQLFGLAFQIQDDILDIEGNTLTLGKQQGADSALNKSTYPIVTGINAAKEKLRSLYEQAIECLELFNKEAEPLRLITEYIIQRDH